MEQRGRIVALDAEFYFRALLAAQALDYLLVGYLFPGDDGIVDGNDAVAREDSYFFRRAAGDDLVDSDGVGDGVEADADAAERTFDVLVVNVKIGRGYVGGVRVELEHYFGESVLEQAVDVDLVDIVLGDIVENGLKLGVAGAFGYGVFAEESATEPEADGNAGCDDERQPYVETFV